MRRTILYTAGLLFAAGASLGLAGPASAAPAAQAPCNFIASCFTSTNTQAWNQTNTSNQAVATNSGNSQFGLLNINGGGTSTVSNSSSQSGTIRNW